MNRARERRNRRRKIAAAVVVGALVAGWMFVRWTDRDEPVGAFPSSPPAEAVIPQPKPRSTPPTPPSTDSPAARRAGFGQETLSGLPGGSASLTMSKHTVVLRAWSAKPMAFTAWYVPTRQGEKHGGKRLPGSTWSMTTVAYGQPDYAQLYLQTDVTGEPVHCSITVDGKVTARETTEGPYGTIMCQG